MLAYLPLIQKVLLGYISRKGGEARFSFNFVGLGLMALTGILLFLSLIFVLLALQNFCAEIYGETAAWLIVATATLVLSFISLLCAHFSKKKNGIMTRIREEAEEGTDAVSDFVKELAEPIKEHPLAAVAIAGLAGILAADKLKAKGTED